MSRTKKEASSVSLEDEDEESLHSSDDGEDNNKKSLHSFLDSEEDNDKKSDDEEESSNDKQLTNNDQVENCTLSPTMKMQLMSTLTLTTLVFQPIHSRKLHGVFLESILDLRISNQRSLVCNSPLYSCVKFFQSKENNKNKYPE